MVTSMEKLNPVRNRVLLITNNRTLRKNSSKNKIVANGDIKRIVKIGSVYKNEPKRTKNFNGDEINLLLKLVEENKKVLENKSTDKASQQQKESAWHIIQKQFNLESREYYRDAKTLKGKYENMKKVSRRKWAENKRYEEEEEEESIIISSSLGETQFESLPSYYLSDCLNSAPTLTEIVAQEEVVKPRLPVSELEDQHLTEEENETPKTPELKKKNEGSDVTSSFDASVPPLRARKKKIPIFGRTKTSKKIEELSSSKKELIDLQKKICEEQHKFQRDEHLLRKKHLEEEQEERSLRMMLMKEEHEYKIKLLKIQIKKEELELQNKKK